MRILYVGVLWNGGTCLQRMRAMQDVGQVVVSVDTAPELVRELQKSFFYRIKRKLFGPSDLARANPKIISLISTSDFDALWLDNAQTISPETLRIVRQVSPKTIIVGYSPDDMAGKHNQSRAFLGGLPFYHLYFTTKSYGVKELKDMGVKQVFFIGQGYDPATHRPVALSEKEKKHYGGKVGFVGDYEDERAQLMFYLAGQGIPVRIWGPNWGMKCRLCHPNMTIEDKYLYSDEYAKAICAFNINCGFLRKINRDLQTTRSVEIPACGAFMLAERTQEHLELFEEGKEAEFFSTKEELLEKVRYYLNHSEKRKQIAQAGRERCLRSGYSNQERMKKMFEIIGQL